MSPLHGPLDPVARLRARAEALRRTAVQIERIDLGRVVRLVGDETWVGATALACAEEVAGTIRHLGSAGDDLRRAAAVLDRQADDLSWSHRAAGAPRWT